jgi:hypothetical protein|tara:strand:- start:128 stop:346 length:219 start_codon:yes stop_codon:yes gene_type:complete
MRLTVIPQDRSITKDNLCKQFSEWPFADSHIHAIQWFDGTGEIEYAGKPPTEEVITEEAVIQPYVSLFEQAS